MSKLYNDGIKKYDLPQWKKSATSYAEKNKRIYHQEIMGREGQIKEDEIALKHPVHGSTVKLTDEGCIEIFANDRLGMRMDPSSDSLFLFAENIFLFGQSIDVNAKNNGIHINKHTLNSNLFFENENEEQIVLHGERKKNGKVESVNLKPFEQKKAVAPYSKEAKELMRKVGLLNV